MPGRFKSFNYYNAGAVFDAIMAVFKPMVSKKMQERVRKMLRYKSLKILMSVGYLCISVKS